MQNSFTSQDVSHPLSHSDLNKEKVRSEILGILDTTVCAQYIKDEVKKMTQYMNMHRLSNILKNLDFFLDYMLFIDKKNNNIIADLLSKQVWNLEHLSYYFSQIGLNNSSLSSSSDSSAKKIVSSLEFLSHITAMKGYLLLTMEEFCYASLTRIAIKQLLYTKETCEH